MSSRSPSSRRKSITPPFNDVAKDEEECGCGSQTSPTRGSPRSAARSLRSSPVYQDAVVVSHVPTTTINSILDEKGFRSVKNVSVLNESGKKELDSVLAMTPSGYPVYVEPDIVGVGAVGGPNDIVVSPRKAPISSSLIQDTVRTCNNGITCGTVVSCKGGICKMTPKSDGTVHTEILVDNSTPVNRFHVQPDGTKTPIVLLSTIRSNPTLVDNTVKKFSPVKNIPAAVGCTEKGKKLEESVKKLYEAVESHNKAVIIAFNNLKLTSDTLKAERSELVKPGTNLNALSVAQNNRIREIDQQLMIHQQLHNELLNICPRIDEFTEMVDRLQMGVYAEFERIATDYKGDVLKHKLSPNSVRAVHEDLSLASIHSSVHSNYVHSSPTSSCRYSPPSGRRSPVAAESILTSPRTSPRSSPRRSVSPTNY